MYKLAMSVLKGEHAWLERGIAAENSEFGNRDTEREDDTDRFAEADEILVGSR